MEENLVSKLEHLVRGLIPETLNICNISDRNLIRRHGNGRNVTIVETSCGCKPDNGRQDRNQIGKMKAIERYHTDVLELILSLPDPTSLTANTRCT